MTYNIMKNNRFLIVLMTGGMLSACSTTPAPSIYKGGQAAVKPAPVVDANAPVVRPLTQGDFKETPLEAKPLPAKPLSSYAPSAIAPTTPMTPTVNYAQSAATAATASASAGAVSVTNGVNEQVALASTTANSSTVKGVTSVSSNLNQANQVANTAAASAKLASAPPISSSTTLPVVALTASPAVRELSANADAAMARGDLTGSAAALERALRIEPNNAGLWSRLSEVRLRQGDTAQAEQLALKSNGLAAGNAALRTRNDKIVAAARGL